MGLALKGLIKKYSDSCGDLAKVFRKDIIKNTLELLTTKIQNVKEMQDGHDYTIFLVEMFQLRSKKI